MTTESSRFATELWPFNNSDVYFELMALLMSLEGLWISSLIAIFAVGIEGLIGYPNAIAKRIRHPVVWIGSLIVKLEKQLNREQQHPLIRQGFGTLTVLIVIGVVLAITVPIAVLCRALGPIGWLCEAALASTCLAQRSLHDHVLRVAQALNGASGPAGLQAGRRELAHIVGRDPNLLDRHGVARGAIETLAENTSDAVIAPMLWLAIGGLPGAVTCKAINTLDSMIGYRSPRFADFGKASARCDDLINLIPARLSAGLICIAATICVGMSGRSSWQAIWRDANRLDSPNAGWPEAAFGGALDLSLVGPMSYHGVISDKPWIGGTNRRADANDIHAALQLYRRVCLVACLSLALIIAVSQLYVRFYS